MAPTEWSLLCHAEDVDAGDVFSAMLVALPGQSPEVPWPTKSWPIGRADGVGLHRLLDDAFYTSGPLAETYAVVIIAGGRMVVERYGGSNAPPRNDPGRSPFDPSSRGR